MFIKICGITEIAAALTAVEAGADAVGFIFYPPSRRFLPPEEAGEIAAHLPAGVARVGVFVDSSLKEMAAAVAAARLTFVQLHGEADTALCRAAREATGCRIIQALRVGPDGGVPVAGWQAGDADYFLLDTAVPGLPGGTGRAFDWRAARHTGLPAPVIVAGGLDPDNVAAALETARPAGVDVSSGVETAGSKDADKIRRFIAAVRRWEDER